MTATTEAATDRLHPYWCDLGRHCTGSGLSVEHVGRSTCFYDTTGDVRVVVRLAQDEDEGPKSGRTVAVLALTATEWLASCETRLTAEEARHLARTLERYAVLSERRVLWMTAEELREDQQRG